MSLRDADELLLPAVRASIAALKDKTGADAAIIKLAERYAVTIDQAPPARTEYVMRYIGPLLHDALESLGATPVARTKTRGKEGSPSGGTSRLATLRAAHTAS
jgi:hypothetical protein